MNASTFTIASTPVFDGTWGGNYRQYEPPMVTSFLGHSRNTGSYAASILREAHALDVLHDAHRINNDWAGLYVPVAPAELSASERDDAAAMRQASALNASATQANKLRAIIEERRDALALVEKYKAELHAQIVTSNALRGEQIVGNDERLTDFWERAMQKANDENFCSEYDRMAEALDGPRRTTPGVATVRVVAYVNISVDDIESYDIDDYEVMGAVAELSSSDFNWEVQDTNAD